MGNFEKVWFFLRLRFLTIAGRQWKEFRKFLKVAMKIVEAFALKENCFIREIMDNWKCLPKKL